MPYSQHRKSCLFIAMLLSAISGILLLLPMVYIHRIIKEVILSGSSNFDTLKSNALYAAILPMLGLLLYALATVCSHIFAFEVEQNIIKSSMQKLLAMPLGYFQDKESGKLRNIILTGAGETHSILAHQLPDMASALISPIVILIFLFLFDWRLGIVCLLPISVGMTFMATMMTEQGKADRDAYYGNLNILSAESIEYVRGIPIVKVFGQSILNFRQLYKSIMTMKESVLKMALGWQNKMALYEAVTEATAFFLVPVAILLIMYGNNPKQIIINTIIYLLIGPIFGIFIMRNATISQYMYFASQGLDKIEEALDYPEMTDGTESTLSAGSLEFRNVSFSYADEQILDNVSFTLNKGETVALVGASGGGKSTIAKLAARFYDPQSGTILIGGKDIKNYTKTALMKNIAIVFQNAKLFKQSLKDNILMGKPNASEEEIQTALNEAGASEIISSLPNGLETIYGTKGTYLSGGEAQRLVLARAFLKNPDYLILDEATAFADPENEKQILTALHKLAKNKTTLMIAHRLSSVVNVDRILVVDNGQIKEAGKHAELLAKQGIYAKMWQEYQASCQWEIGGRK